MARNVKLTITDASGNAVSIASDPNREELPIRNAGPDRVWIAFNEPATEDLGIYLDSGDVIFLSQVGHKRSTRATASIYMTCTSGTSATVYADLTS